MSASELQVDLDLTGDAPADMEEGGVMPEGRYHAVLPAIKREAEEGRTPCLRVKYQTVAGPAVGCSGSERFFLSGSERFFLSLDAKKRLKILAHRLGLIGEKDFGRPVNPDFRRDFPLAMRWIAEGRIDLAPLVTHRYTIEKVQTAFETFRDRTDGALKVLVDFASK